MPLQLLFHYLKGLNEMKELKVFTLNVWSGFRYNGLIKLEEYEAPRVREKRYQGLLKEIRRLDPDVIFLNEVNPMFKYANRLAKELSYDWIGHMGVAGVRAFGFGFPINLREGDVILAKKELNLKFVSQKHLGGKGYCGNYFSFHFDNLTQGVLGKITAGGKEVYLCCTHWIAAPCVSEENLGKIEELAEKWKFDKAEIPAAKEKLLRINDVKVGEAKRLTDWLGKKVPGGAPLIVGGDFNAEAHWEELTCLAGRGYRRIEPRDDGIKTWDPRFNTNLRDYYMDETKIKQKSLYHQLDAEDEMPERNIDHFFASDIEQVENEECFVAATEKHGGRSVSDHFGLFCKVYLD